MSALPPEQSRTMRNSTGSLAQRWADLHESAAQLAKISGLSAEPFTGKQGDFAARLDSAHGWQFDMAAQGIDDIDAMMRPGLAALGTLAERGQDPSVPAQALWREFHFAREAVLAMVEPPHN